MDRLPDRHMVDRNLDTITYLYFESRIMRGLDYFIPEKEEVHMLLPCPKSFQQGYIGLSIGAQHETKKLPPESLVELCQKLEHPGIDPGGPEDQEHREKLIVSSLPERQILNGCGKYSIHQSASLVRQSRVLITHDTGLMHIGAAFQKKIISVWGNTVPRFRDVSLTGLIPHRFNLKYPA